MPPTYSEITKPTTPSYTETTKPNSPSYTTNTKPAYKRFLLAQDGNFLVFQDGSLINIAGDATDEIKKPSYSEFLLQECMNFLLLEDGGKIEITDECDHISEITKPEVPNYTEITRPL